MTLNVDVFFQPSLVTGYYFFEQRRAVRECMTDNGTRFCVDMEPAKFLTLLNQYLPYNVKLTIILVSTYERGVLKPSFDSFAMVFLVT
jgi:hypothetical protein